VDEVWIRPPAPERSVPGMIVNRAPASEPEAPRDHRQVVVLNDGVAPTHDRTSRAAERADLPARGRKAGERDLNLAVRVIGDGRFAPRVQRAVDDVPITKVGAECDASGGRPVVVAEADSNVVAAEGLAQKRRRIGVVPFFPLERRLLGKRGFPAALTECGRLAGCPADVPLAGPRGPLSQKVGPEEIGLPALDGGRPPEALPRPASLPRSPSHGGPPSEPVDSARGAMMKHETRDGRCGGAQSPS
jgi:hypothetical protein